MEQTDEDKKPDMLTVKDVCEKLQVSRWTVHQLVTSGKLASVKIGRRRLVPREALEAYVGSLKEGG